MYIDKDSMQYRFVTDKASWYGVVVDNMDKAVFERIKKIQEDYIQVQSYLRDVEGLLAGRVTTDISTVEVPECLRGDVKVTLEVPPVSKPKKKASDQGSRSWSLIKRKKIQSGSSTNQREQE